MYLLDLRILALRQDVLSNLLLDAKRAYFAAQEDLISIYVSDT